MGHKCENCDLFKIDNEGNEICNELQDYVENIEWCPAWEEKNEQRQV